MDSKSFERGRGETKGKSGPIDGPQSEVQLNRAAPGDVPFNRPISQSPQTPSNK